MGKRIDASAARRRLNEAVDWAFDDSQEVPQHWVEVTRYIGDSPSQTLVAGLGAALLARAVRDDVDPLSIKAQYSADTFSLRTLCHGVLVPASKDPGRPFHLGVRGREPLNNQPYFRYDHLDEVDRIHSSARVHFDYLKDALRELGQVGTDDALAALAAFIRVRAQVQQEFDSARRAALPDVRSSRAIFDAIGEFLYEDATDRPLRLQGIVGGLVAAIVGDVETGAIHDPSRHAPGDIHVPDSRAAWWAAEVRGKPVPQYEAAEFVRQCASADIGSAWVLVVDEDHRPLDREALTSIARRQGIFVMVIESLDELLAATLASPALSSGIHVGELAPLIRDHLDAAGAETPTIERWSELIGGHG